MRIVKKITLTSYLCLLLLLVIPETAKASDTGQVTVSYISQYEEPQIIETGTSNKQSVVKTGDKAQLETCSLLVIISAALLLLIIIERKREKEEEF